MIEVPEIEKHVEATPGTLMSSRFAPFTYEARRDADRPIFHSGPASLALGTAGSDSNHTNVALPRPVAESIESRLVERDATGRSKVSSTGRLSSGGQYSLKTFTIIGRGDELFMLAAEVARVTGYRDSYLLFLRNKKLRKVVTTRTERNDLVRRGLIPFSSRYRPISVVSGRSVFIQFRHRIVDKRPRILRDYYPNRAILDRESFVRSTEVRPKVPISELHHDAFSSYCNNVVQPQVRYLSRRATFLPSWSSSELVTEYSTPSDQTVKSLSPLRNTLPDAVANRRESQRLPSIRELFGTPQDQSTSSMLLDCNHRPSSPRNYCFDL